MTTDDAKQDDLPGIDFSTLVLLARDLGDGAHGPRARVRGRLDREEPAARAPDDRYAELLENKTRGNLTDDETRLLQSVLYELRMSYVKRAAADPEVCVVELDAPAKVNLGPRVVGRRADGYHELESLFVPLDLADAIACASNPRARPRFRSRSTACRGVRPATSNPRRAGGARVPRARGNRGARRDPPHQAHAGRGGPRRRIERCGRGAARARRGVSGRRARPTRSRRSRSRSVADVPFFLDPQPAWAPGSASGARRSRACPGSALLLANPGEALATREVFRAFDALAPPRTAPRPARATSRELAEEGRSPRDSTTTSRRRGAAASTDRAAARPAHCRGRTRGRDVGQRRDGVRLFAGRAACGARRGELRAPRPVAGTGSR